MINEERIRRQCEARGFSVHFNEGIICINSGKANWRLMHDNNQVYKVLHENYRGLRYSREKYASGYHEQKLWNFQMKNILNYIEKHDELFLNKGTSDYERMLRHVNSQKLSIA